MAAGKPILTVEELRQQLGLRGVFGLWVARFVYWALDIDWLNACNARCDGVEGPAFSQRVLDDVGVKYEIPEEQLGNIPSEGGFITVSNHHYGSLDGLILSAVVGGRRKDFRILTTFLLTLIPGLKESFLPVNNFSSAPSAKSVKGLRMALEHIAGGGALGLFPAGEVATYQKKGRRTAVGKPRIEDIPWADNIIRIIRSSGLPVVPIYFDGTNSRLFHLMGRIHPSLRTVRLIHEMFNKRGRVISVRIGRPITPEEIAAFADTRSLGAYLRNRCYALEAQCGDAASEPALSVSERVAPGGDAAMIAAELEGLKERILFESGDWRGYLLRAEEAPRTLQEIARLREETFRSVGEGTGLASDTDAFDTWYHHLVLWNIPDGLIAGAYRIGVGSEIVPPRGKEGLYVTSLYRFGADTEGLLSRCLELGRSFIVPRYQRNVMALKLLFTGLALTVTDHPETDYFLGPVSISNAYPAFYKSLMVYYFQTRFPFTEQKGVALPNHPFIPDFLGVDPEALLQGCTGIEDFDRLLDRLSDGRYRLPVLVRQYFKMGARLVCFNVDVLFNDSLDGLILLKFKDYPESTLRSVVRFLPDEVYEGVMKRFA